MKILVANIPLPGNRFLVDLNNALSKSATLLHDHEAFWDMEGEFDVIHLHFPEYLTFKTQKAYKTTVSEQLLQEIEERLQYWSERSVLIITRHVLLPHGARTDPMWEELYELVYRYVDGVVHFAPPSVTEFNKRYEDTNFLHGEVMHVVVPHQNYISLPNTVTRKEARKKLGIKENASVMLVFGGIRSDSERELILDSFKNANVRGKVLLVSRWREKLADVSWIRLKYWIRDVVRFYYKLNPTYNFNYAFVKEEDAQLYMNAADVLFIPRLHVLNSGNITMGMTFGRVVVGPDSLDVGHLLHETGNPTFDPDNPETASKAIEKAFELAIEGGVPRGNKELALSEWGADQCANDYIKFFKDAQSRRNRAMEEIA